MGDHRAKRLLALINVCASFGVYDVSLCVHIINRSSGLTLGNGKSSYARRRRAKSIGRCERCYRVFPPVCNSKCDNKTCRPGMSQNRKVVDFIRYGVTEVIPHPGFNF